MRKDRLNRVIKILGWIFVFFLFVFTIVAPLYALTSEYYPINMVQYYLVLGTVMLISSQVIYVYFLLAVALIYIFTGKSKKDYPSNKEQEFKVSDYFEPVDERSPKTDFESLKDYETLNQKIHSENHTTNSESEEVTEELEQEELEIKSEEIEDEELLNEKEEDKNVELKNLTKEEIEVLLNENK